MAALPTVCVIGAGCSGFTTANRLKDFGVPFEVFEASDDIGGNWYFANPNGDERLLREAPASITKRGTIRSNSTSTIMSAR